ASSARPPARKPGGTRVGPAAPGQPGLRPSPARDLQSPNHPPPTPSAVKLQPREEWLRGQRGEGRRRAASPPSPSRPDPDYPPRLPRPAEPPLLPPGAPAGEEPPLRGGRKPAPASSPARADPRACTRRPVPTSCAPSGARQHPPRGPPMASIALSPPSPTPTPSTASLHPAPSRSQVGLGEGRGDQTLSPLPPAPREQPNTKSPTLVLSHQ
uniref:Uncharacterized protein n=1 Tax=Myotis lucifugus TaxID=59463 RepID=G1PYT8_MYOLU